MTTQGFIDQRYERVKKYDVPANQMETRSARNLPNVEDIKYNEVVSLDIAMLFCDIKGFTKIVRNASDPKTIARIMTIYITEMAAAIRNHGGEILSIRGDGIIGAFTDSSNRNASTIAVRCAVTMSTSLDYVVNKRLRYFNQNPLSCRWGADYGKIRMTRAGLHGGDKNDLIYIGNAINYASKFSEIVKEGEIGISEYMHNQLENYYRKSDNGWNWTGYTNTNYGKYYSKFLNHWRGINEPN